ncbi:MAG: MptD family putative ECF transporter S component [Eubacteriales bacterium]|nr:MptD family putative ECF transporter S component [Eubacteriales bacterium]
MKINDLLKIVLLSVIGFVLEMIGGYASLLFGTYALYISHALASLIVAPVFFVLCHKVHKRGTLFLYYILMGLIYTIMGFWPMLIIYAAAAVIAELLVFKPENYSNNRRLTVTYVVAQTVTALHGLFFVLFIGLDGMARLFPDMFDDATIKMTGEFMGKTGNVVAVIVIQIVIAFIGAIFGIFIYSKFFAKRKKEKTLLN